MAQPVQGNKNTDGAASEAKPVRTVVHLRQPFLCKTSNCWDTVNLFSSTATYLQYRWSLALAELCDWKIITRGLGLVTCEALMA